MLAMARLRAVENEAQVSREPDDAVAAVVRRRELQVLAVRRALSGEPVAIRRILDHVGPSMLRVSRAVLGVGAAEAEDVVQESLLALYDALPAYRGDCSLRHYGCRIAARIAVRARRRAARLEERRGELMAAVHTRGSRERQPDCEVAAERRKAALRRLLDRLPEEQAEALTMRIVLGFSLAEVAEASDVPINTVRSRIRLAKEAMRRHIEADPEAADLAEVEP